MTRTNGRELQRSRIALITSLVVMAAASTYYVKIFFWSGSSHMQSDVIAFLIAVPLVYGNLVYQVARLGALGRTNAHRRAERWELEHVHSGSARSLTILIPSYKEEPQVLRQTALSAALLEYPGRRIVVLIDDPPGDHASQTATWSVIHELNQKLGALAQKFDIERDAYRRRQAAGGSTSRVEARKLADLLNEFACWLESLADEWALDEGSSHSSSFFVNRILLAPAGAHRQRAAKLLTRPMTTGEIECEYVRLAELVKGDIIGFERKNIQILHTVPIRR